MNRVVLIGKKAAILIGAIFLAGCSGIPVATATKDVAPAHRSPAAITGLYGLECVSNAKIIRELDAGSDSSSGLDPDLNASLGKLSGEDRARSIAVALADAFAYGQSLLEAFDALLDRGRSLETIMQNSDVYAELHSLYFLRHELDHIASSEIATALLQKLEAEASVSGGTAGARANGLALIKSATNEQIAKWRSYIAERLNGPEYGVLALAATEDHIDELHAVADACPGITRPVPLEGKFRAFLDRKERQWLVLRAAHSWKKNSNAYRAFEPRPGEGGPSIEAIVKKRAAKIRAEWKALAERSPQSVSSAKVVYPDAGKPGNLFGNTFPKGVWALTFDDGPHGGDAAEPSYTRKVLENLKNHRMKATFFVLSQQIERKDCDGVGPRTISVRDKRGRVISTTVRDIRKKRPAAVFPELAQKERDDGHAVGSHSYYHSEVPKDDDVEQKCEIDEAIRVFADQLGSRPAFFRLPYGAGVSVPKVRAKIAQAGAIHVHWNVDTLDWQDQDPESIVRRTLKQIALNGRGVILFHDVHPQSVVASEKIMEYLKDPANKLETVTLPEIVDRLNGKSSGTPFGVH